MKCPLSRYRLKSNIRAIKEEWEDCLESECAWFDKANDNCSMQGFNQIMIAIGNTLGKIADIMPHEGQFRK